MIPGGRDNAAAAIGLGISSTHLQQGSLSIGTSGVIFALCDRPIPDAQGRVHLFCHVDGGYHLLGVTLAAGGSLRWYRDTFAPHTSYPDLMALADTAPPGAHGVLFLPHLAGERSPYLDPDARGAWVNLSLSHTQADIVRAVLEGVAFSLRATLEVINELFARSAVVSYWGRGAIAHVVTNSGRWVENRLTAIFSRVGIAHSFFKPFHSLIVGDAHPTVCGLLM